MCIDMAILREQEKKDKRFMIRLTEKEFNELKQKATLYAGGNVSYYIRAAIRKFRPSPKDLVMD